MSLFYFKGDSVKGNFFENCQKKVLLVGTTTGRTVSLTAFYHNILYGYLIADLIIDTSAFTGIWYDSLRQKKIGVNIRYENEAPVRTFQHRYTFGFPPEEIPDSLDDKVESFAQAIKEAVETNNKVWMADHTKFPSTIWRNRKEIVYKSKDDFLTNYTFPLNFVERFKSTCPHNLAELPMGIDLYGFWIGYVPDDFTGGKMTDSLVIWSIP